MALAGNTERHKARNQRSLNLTLIRLLFCQEGMFLKTITHRCCVCLLNLIRYTVMYYDVQMLSWADPRVVSITLNLNSTNTDSYISKGQRYIKKLHQICWLSTHLSELATHVHCVSFCVEQHQGDRSKPSMEESQLWGCFCPWPWPTHTSGEHNIIIIDFGSLWIILWCTLHLSVEWKGVQ